jgi:hypothetical protein
MGNGLTIMYVREIVELAFPVVVCVHSGSNIKYMDEKIQRLVLPIGHWENVSEPKLEIWIGQSV